MKFALLRFPHFLAIGCASLIAPLAIAAAPAAPAASTTTYTLISPAPTAKDMSTAIYRDGSRETITLSRASSGWHSQQWFDFAAHKQWATDSNAPGQCSVIDYTSDGPPGMLDPVAGAFAMAAQIPVDTPRSGTAKLGGINTQIIQDPVSGSTFWLDPAHQLVLKYQTAGGAGQSHTMLDLSSIRFDKPDPVLLTPPTNCKHINGSSNANGGHAETQLQP